MLFCVYMQAAFMLEDGCLPHEVDQVMKVFGFPMGLFEVADLSGMLCATDCALSRSKVHN